MGQNAKSICPECGREFVPKSVVQIFCSLTCGKRYRRKHGAAALHPSVTFTCANPGCGRVVVTEAGTDRRTRFCCSSCEKKYWRHPPYEQETSRTNFHSLREYLSWEKRTNE